MSKQRDNNILPTFGSPADATVEAILNEETRKHDEMQLSSEERKRLIEQRRKDATRKEKARQKAQQQNKVLLSIPPDLDEQLQHIADWQQVTKSQVATFLLYEAMQRFQQGQISFEGHKHVSYNPRYDFELIHPLDGERQKRRSVKKQKNGWG